MTAIQLSPPTTSTYAVGKALTRSCFPSSPNARRRTISRATWGARSSFRSGTLSARRWTIRICRLPANLRFKKPVFRPRQPQILPQRLAFVFLPENPALLQFRHHLVDEIVEACGEIREHA